MRRVMVPPGVQPGQQFMIQVPAAQVRERERLIQIPIQM